MCSRATWFSTRGVANADRHALNWLALEGDGYRLAATFDHGSALGAGMGKAGHLRASARVDRYARRGMAQRFDHGPDCTLVDLAHLSLRKAGPDAQQWLERLGSLTSSQWQAVLGSDRGSVGACVYVHGQIARGEPEEALR